MINLQATLPKLKPTWDSVVKWGLVTCTSVIFGGVLLCLYWLLLDREQPVTVHYGEVVRFERQANDSWVMIIKWHGERHKKCWGNSRRWISGDFLLPLPDIPYPPDRPDQQIGPFTWEVPVEIPSYYVSTGHVSGQYSISISYACNPIQEYLFPITVNPEPVRFKIPTEMPRKNISADGPQIFRPAEPGK